MCLFNLAIWSFHLYRNLYSLGNFLLFCRMVVCRYGTEMIMVYSKMSAIMPNVFNKRAMRKLMLMCFLSPSSQDLLESLSLSLMYSVFTDWSDSECSSWLLMLLWLVCMLSSFLCMTSSS